MKYLKSKQYDNEFIKQNNCIPDEMKPYWEEEAFRTWNTCEWWKKVLLKSDNFEMKKIQEMDCFEVAWNDWLGTEDNRFAVGDRPTIEKDNGRYMNLISIIGNKK